MLHHKISSLTRYLFYFSYFRSEVQEGQGQVDFIKFSWVFCVQFMKLKSRSQPRLTLSMFYKGRQPLYHSCDYWQFYSPVVEGLLRSCQGSQLKMSQLASLIPSHLIMGLELFLFAISYLLKAIHRANLHQKIRNHFQPVFSKIIQFDNLDEIDQFLDVYIPNSLEKK